MFAIDVKSDFQIQLDPIKKAFNKLSQQQFLKTLKQAAVFMISSTRAGFDKSINPKGIKWPELAEWYKYRPMEDGIVRPPKRPVGPKAKPLVNYGDMKKHISSMIVGKNTAIIGYSVKEDAIKAERHQKGTTSKMRIQLKSGKIVTWEVTPKIRETIGFSAKVPRFGPFNDIESIVRLFENALEEAMRF